MDMGMDQKGMDHKGMDHKGLWHRVSSGRVRGPARQRGSVFALVAVGMLAIIGMAGLALQSGHLFVNKTHLQNALDAAALSAAKTLNNDGTVAKARQAGLAAFQTYIGDDQNGDSFVENEMQQDPVLTPTIRFSATLDPFVETAVLPATFVRASVTDFTMDTWLANFIPGIGAKKDIGGTAVAGPAPISPANTCDVLPLVMCPPPGVADDPDSEVCLKEGGGSACPKPLRGDFRRLKLVVDKEDAAGRYSGCVEVGANAETEPVGADPVHKGLNTRFGEYEGGLTPEEYPPDTVVTEPLFLPKGTCTGFCYLQYVARQLGEQYDHEPMPDGDGVPDRRKVAVPIGDCTGLGPEATEVPVIGIGCFFLTRQADTEVYGQLVGECEADGSIAAQPGGPHKIVLYKNPGSPDS